MSTAFGASLFGLSGSLVMGFLELQASQAQGRFHIELEEWLARATSLSSAGLPAGPQGIPAYVEALLERNTEGVDGLIRGLQRIEDSRLATAANNATLIERLAALAETTRAQQNLLARFTELSIELRGAITRLSDRATGTEAEREALLGHQANIESHLGRLVEETMRTRSAAAEEVRGLAAGLPDRATAEADRDRLLEGQRSIETQVGRYVTKLTEDAQRDRERMLDELRNLSARLSDRAATDADGVRRHNELTQQLKQAIDRLTDGSGVQADREGLANMQRAVEGQLGRLLQESARDRASLAEDLRTAIGRLAERFVDVDRDAMAAHQRNIEAHLARLVEDTAQNRSALADELRGEIRLLARTIALRNSAAAPQPSADG